MSRLRYTGAMFHVSCVWKLHLTSYSWQAAKSYSIQMVFRVWVSVPAEMFSPCAAACKEYLAAIQSQNTFRMPYTFTKPVTGTSNPNYLLHINCISIVIFERQQSHLLVSTSLTCRTPGWISLIRCRACIWACWTPWDRACPCCAPCWWARSRTWDRGAWSSTSSSWGWAASCPCPCPPPPPEEVSLVKFGSLFGKFV